MKDYPDRMTPEQARVFGEDVLNIVSQIPCGRVTTYGHIAVLAGWPSHSRMVGRTLRYSPGAEQVPCHRVVNREGGLSEAFYPRGRETQRERLAAEDVPFTAEGRVELARCMWYGPEPPDED